MIKIITILTMLICFTITGCGNNSVNVKKKKDQPSEIPNQNIENKELSILEAISQDQKYDGKSILWDGEQIAIIDDVLDDKDICDGRSGPYRNESIETKLGIILECIYTGYNSELFDIEQYPVTDTEDEYTSETSIRYLSVRKSSKDSYSKLEEELSANTEIMEVNDKAISTQRDIRLFTGKAETPQGKDMIGFTIITPDVDQSVFCITYAGFGNYSDIQVEAYSLFDDFFINN